MATTIPYDPSLALANIVPEEKLTVLKEIGKAQAPVDAAQEKLNSALLALRSLDMTISELANLQVDLKDVDKEREAATKDVSAAAGELIKARLESNKKVATLRTKMQGIIDDAFESPIDYNKTTIKQMPISADSLSLDAQYFSFDKNMQRSASTMVQMANMVSGSTGSLGAKISAETTAKVTAQVSKQLENHDIQGTLIITATCTHKNALLLAPLVIDVDKGIRAWNAMGMKPKIKSDDPGSMAQIALEAGTDKESSFNILSGATYGSSFIGMVHILRTSNTETNQNAESAAASAQVQMTVGNWLAKASGGFGVDTSVAREVKNLLSSQKISSHISLITVGAIPTITANNVKIAVKEFTEFDPKASMEALGQLNAATDSANTSVTDAARAARTGGQMLQIRGTEIKNVMAGVGEIDDGQNKMLDINSLMTAFEDYVAKVLSGNVGVPITYYLKPITAAQLAQMWVAKYLPAQYVTSAGDDTTPQQPQQPAAPANG